MSLIAHMMKDLRYAQLLRDAPGLQLVLPRLMGKNQNECGKQIQEKKGLLRPSEYRVAGLRPFRQRGVLVFISHHQFPVSGCFSVF